jgi:hypothetical protein
VPDTRLEDLPAQLSVSTRAVAAAAVRAARSSRQTLLSPHDRLVCVNRADVNWRLAIARSEGRWRLFGVDSDRPPYVPLDVAVTVGLKLEERSEGVSSRPIPWLIELPSFFAPAADAALGIPDAPARETVFLQAGGNLIAIHLLDDFSLRPWPRMRVSRDGVPGPVLDDEFPLQPILDVLDDLRLQPARGVPLARTIGAADDNPARRVLDLLTGAYEGTRDALAQTPPFASPVLANSRYDAEVFRARVVMSLDADAEVAEEFEDEVQRMEVQLTIASGETDARILVQPCVITRGPAYDAFFAALNDPALIDRPTDQLDTLADLLERSTAAAQRFAASAHAESVLVSTGAKAGLFNREPMYLVLMRGTLDGQPTTLVFAGKFDGRDAEMSWETGRTQRLALVVGARPPGDVDRRDARWFFSLVFNSYIWAQRLAG